MPCCALFSFLSLLRWSDTLKMFFLLAQLKFAQHYEYNLDHNIKDNKWKVILWYCRTHIRCIAISTCSAAILCKLLAPCQWATSGAQIWSLHRHLHTQHLERGPSGPPCDNGKQHVYKKIGVHRVFPRSWQHNYLSTSAPRAFVSDIMFVYARASVGC